MAKVVLCAILLSVVAQISADPANGSCESTDYCYNGLVNGAPCQCNDSCVNFGDCCFDFQTVCNTCKAGPSGDRCGKDYVPGLPCQCNSECEEFGNCCPDKTELCGGPVDLRALSESLLSQDKSLYGGGSFVSVDFGGTVSGCSGGDISPNPFITRYDPILNGMPTYKELIDLFDDFSPDEGLSEDHNAQDQADENAFLDAVLATTIMQDTYDFLVANRYFTGDYASFKAKLNEMWFGQYDRGAPNSSSGFEHVFMGELASDKVGGFHGWVHFQYEEAAGNLQYYANYVHNDFGNGYGGVTNYFYWYGIDKCKGGGFYGTSPALEMALYSICWLVHPNSLCTMSFNGIDFDIQTYVQDSRYIGSAYPIFY